MTWLVRAEIKQNPVGEVNAFASGPLFSAQLSSPFVNLFTVVEDSRAITVMCL